MFYKYHCGAHEQGLLQLLSKPTHKWIVKVDGVFLLLGEWGRVITCKKEYKQRKFQVLFHNRGEGNQEISFLLWLITGQ